MTWKTLVLVVPLESTGPWQQPLRRVALRAVPGAVMVRRARPCAEDHPGVHGAVTGLALLTHATVLTGLHGRRQCLGCWTTWRS